jgi:hypothetical protein
MNYKIIGHDGKTYGPTNADQIRLWIAQGRVESRTAVLIEGAGDWTFVGLLPEFATAFNATPPPIGAFKPEVRTALKTNQLATWSLICGVLAWTCCCCCLPFNLAGLVLGIIALIQISSSSTPQEGRGMAIAGVILSATNLLWYLGWTVLNMATNQARLIQNFN